MKCKNSFTLLGDNNALRGVDKFARASAFIMEGYKRPTRSMRLNTGIIITQKLKYNYNHA